MLPDDLKSLLLSNIEDARASYEKDLSTMSEAQLAHSPGGNARCPYDFTYEVVLVNNRVAMRLRGEDPGPWSFESWVTAPPEFRVKEAAIAAFNASVVTVLEAVGDDVTRNLDTANGPKSVFSMAHFCAMHIMYHDAQLNYLQAMNGDSEMHW